MAKGKRHTSAKKKNSKPDDDIDDGNDIAGAKKCPHLSKGVKCQHLQNKVPHITLGHCSNCDETNSPVGVWICLNCSHQGCDRYSKEKHALSHFGSNRSHSIVLHLQNWVVWCYICDDEVPTDSSPMLHEPIKLLRKAMNLPINTSGVNTPNNQDAIVTNFMSDKQDAGPSSKNPSQFRGQIKGLSNLGNTCFFNAVVQNLCQIDLLYVALSFAVKRGYPQLVCSNNKDLPQLSVTVQEEPGSVTAALWGLLTDVQTSNNRTLNPRHLFGEICKKATRFKGYRQQDSQELLRYLLDSIRNEELRRVKSGLLKAFDIKKEGDAKNLEDNKRTQIKEYNARAQAPLIDSVFAGKLVSIVICHQCCQEFKVEETFLDLSLPLTTPQETNSNKHFAKLGRQSQQSLATPSSSIPKKQNGDEGKDLKAKTPSKHQLKAAKEAERKKKKGKGLRKKGKVSPESKEETQDDMEKDDTEEFDKECNGPAETNKYDTELYNNEKESNMIQGNCSDLNNAEVGEPTLSTDHEEAVDQKEDAQEEETESIISNETHGPQCVDSNKVSYVEESQSQPLTLSEIKIQFLNEGEPGANKSITNEATGTEINEEENQNNELSIKGRINQSDGFGSPDENPLELRKPLESEVEIPNNSVVNLQQCNLEGPPSAVTGRFETSTVVKNAALAQTKSNEAQIENILRSRQDDQQVELEGSVPLNTIRTDEIEEKMEVMTLNSSEKSEGCTNRVKDDENQTLPLNYTTSLENVVDNDRSIQDQRNFSAENSVVSDDPEHSSHSTETEIALNEALSSEGSFSSMQTEAPSSSVENFGASGSVKGVLNENNQDEINNGVSFGLHEGMCGRPSRCNDNDVEKVNQSEDSNGSDSAANSDPQTTNEVEDITDKRMNEENSSSEFESDSEDDSSQGSPKILTLKPPYDPSPGECSVMSSLSQFCAAELLDGSNKFACEECSKRAQRVKEGKVYDKEKQGVDNTSSDSSSEDDCKGAKAPKPKKKQSKESNQQIVYTEASKQMLISVAPPVLTLHLKRFQQARFTLRKITKHVDFPLLLDLAPFCSWSGQSRADSDDRVLYSLYGVVEHSGSLHSGHYTAYVKVKDPPTRSLYESITSMNELTAFIKNMWTGNPTKRPTCHHEPAADGQWFHVSDSSVSPVVESRVLRGQAYMLFYGRLPLTNS